MEHIGDQLKKIGSSTAKAETAPAGRTSNRPGDPNCPICGGVGFIRQDVPVGDPNFGRIQVCACRQTDMLRSVQEQLYRLSNLESFSHMTFETFKTHGRLGIGDQQVASLENARSAAALYAQNLQGWLLINGSYGCGKTHLAAAIANFVVQLGVPTLFLTVPDLLDWLRFAYDAVNVTFEQRFEEIRSVRLLVLDDLGTQNATPWAQEKLFQIINYRYVNRLPMVVTTNLDLNEIDARISSRLKDPDLAKTIPMNAPDYRSPTAENDRMPISTLHLLESCTFSSFSLREHERLPTDERQNLEAVFHAAREFAENPRGWLILTSTNDKGKSYGCGKTHLAAAIGNYRAALGETPLFVVVPDLLDHLRATFSPTSQVSYDRLFEEVRTTPLLILDDLGTQSATPWAREKLYQIFNYRYNARLPMVITMSATPSETDPRIFSRMQDNRLCQVQNILVPAYRGSTGPLGKSRTPRRKTT